MALDFDIFNPKISEVTKDISGKLLLIHSNERKLGKTFNACKMPKPYYLRFEQGINAISGIPYADLDKWSDFKKVNKQLTDRKTIKQAKEMYQTVIIDTVDVAIKWCEKYVCATQGVSRLNDGNGGYGLWKEYENEWFNEISKLTNANYTVVFISHSEEKTLVDTITKEEYTCMCPKGDKRTIDLILDLVDFIGYVKSNGFDENGDIIPSSIYFGNTKEFQAGSRFTYMTNCIKHFTADNLIAEIIKAIEKEEKVSGIKGISSEERSIKEQKPRYTFEDIYEEVKSYVKLLWKPCKDDVNDIIEKYLGQMPIKEATHKQMEQLEMILEDLQELASDKGLELE